MRLRIKITRTWFPPEFVVDLVELLKVDAGASEVSFRYAVPEGARIGITHFVARLSGEKEVDVGEIERKVEELKVKYGIKAPTKVVLEEENGQ